MVGGSCFLVSFTCVQLLSVCCVVKMCTQHIAWNSEWSSDLWIYSPPAVLNELFTRHLLTAEECSEVARMGWQKWEKQLGLALSTKPAEAVQEAIQVLEERGCPVKQLKSGLYYSSTLWQVVCLVLHYANLTVAYACSNCMDCFNSLRSKFWIVHAPSLAIMEMFANEAKLLSAFSKLPPARKYSCKIVDCFLDPFRYLNQHAWRKMAEYGSKELSGLTKGFEGGSKLAQLTCCCLQSSALSWASVKLKFAPSKAYLRSGTTVCVVNASKFAMGTSRRLGRFTKWKLCHSTSILQRAFPASSHSRRKEAVLHT